MVAFVVCLLFFVLFLFVCLCCSWNDGFLDYVQVPHQFSLAVLNKQTTSCINLEINDSAMPQSVLNDLAKVKGVGRKKEPHCFDVSGVTGGQTGQLPLCNTSAATMGSPWLASASLTQNTPIP